MPDRHDQQPRTLRYHETGVARPMPAGQAILVGLIALGLAALLNADSLYALANRQPYGWQRTTARAFIIPIREVSQLTRLNRPREAILDLAGKDQLVDPDDVEEVVPTTAPPQAAPPAVVLRRPTAAEPLRLWAGGDSMMREVGGAVAEDAADRGTVDATVDYRVSTGLTRPDYFNWPVHLRDDVLPTGPEAMVVLFGANDAQPMEVDGTPYKVRTPQWQAEYRRRVGAAMDQMAGDGRLVIWVGLPRMRDAEFDERMQILNTIYAEEAADRPWVRFVDTAEVLSPPGGGYAAYLDDADGIPQLARQGDGIHLSTFGAGLVSEAVYEVLDAEVAASAAATTTVPASTTTTAGD